MEQKIDKNTKWRVEIVQRYGRKKRVGSLDSGGVIPIVKLQNTLVADLRFKAESAEAAFKLGQAWIKGSELTESCHVQSVICDSPLSIDFSEVDLG